MLVVEEQYRNLSSEHEAMQRSFATVQSERDLLHETFEQTLRTVQERNGVKQDRLYRRLEEVKDKVDKKVRPHKRNSSSFHDLRVFCDFQLDLFSCGCIFTTIQSVQISEIGRAAQLDDVVLQNITDKLQTVLSGKNQQLKMLKFDVTRVKKARYIVMIYFAIAFQAGGF